MAERTLPTAESFGPRPVPTVSRQVFSPGTDPVPAAALEQSKTLAKIGDVVQVEAAIIGKRIDTMDAAYAESSLLRGQIETARDIELNEPDYTKWQALYEERVGKIAADSVKNITSPDQRRLFELKARTSMVKGAEAMRVQARKKEIIQGAASLEELVTGNISGVIHTEDLVAREGLITATHDAIDSAVLRGYITPVQGAAKRRDFAEQVVTGTITQWVRRQTDRYAAVQAIYDGKMPTPSLQKMYDLLPPKSQASIASGLTTVNSRLATLANQQRLEGEREAKNAADAEVRRFYFDDELEFEARQALFEKLSINPHVTATALKGMQDFILEGGPNLGLDNEPDVLEARHEIQMGRIRTDNEFLEALGKFDWRISAETIRKTLSPMIEAQQDELFTDALQWGQSELGVITNAGVMGDFLKDPIDKSAKLEAALRRFRRDTPKGDIWKEAERQVERLKKQGNLAATKNIPSLAQSLRDANASGDASRIAMARTALIFMLVEAGMVGGIEAARQNFNPLALIDEPKEAQ